MSFANIHSRKNIGCCIVRVDEPEDANEECMRLGLMPNVCNSARGFVIEDADFPNEGMELNRFYTSEEMTEMGFKKEKVKIR